MRHENSVPPVAPGSEMRMLVAIACKDRDHAPATLSELLSHSIDWPLLIQAADYHGLTPLLWFHLQQFSTQVPATHAEELRKTAMVVTRNNLKLVSELGQLLPALGPKAMPYKGPLLAEYLYGNIGLRPAVDLDIIVPPASARDAIEMLAKYGYRIDPPLIGAQLDSALRWNYEVALMNGDVALDLHWDVVARGVSVSLGFDHIRERATRRTIAGVSVLWPSPEDHFLLLAVHAGKHLWRKLAWVADIAQLTRQEPMDWECLIERARASRCLRMLLVTAKLAADIFGANIPENATRAIDEDNAVKEMASKAAQTMFAMSDPTLSRARHFSMLRLRERWPDKVRYALSIVTEPQLGDHTAIRLPEGTSRLYPLVRMLRLVGFMGSGPENRGTQ